MTRALGTAVALVGVLGATPDAALLRAMNLAGGTEEVITVWRYVAVGLICLAVAVYNEGGVGPLLKGIVRSPGPILMAAVLMLGINLGFTISLLKVDPAKALLLISLNPLWSAILGVIVLGDALPMRTILCNVAAICSMVLVFVPNVLAAMNGEPPPPSAEGRMLSVYSYTIAAAEENPVMVLIPLATGMLQALFLIYVRYVSMKNPDVSFESVPAFGAAFTAIAPTITALSAGVSLTGGLQPIFWGLLFLMGLGLGAYNVACVVAPKYITGAEVALILLLETVGGPIWVYLIYGDVPNNWTIASCTLLVASLLVHEIAGMMSSGEDHKTTLEPVRASRVSGSGKKKSGLSEPLNP